MLIQLKSLFTNMYLFMGWIISSTFVILFGNDKRTMELLGVLFVLIVIDIILGVINAKKLKVYLSRELSNGVKRKLETLFFVAIAHQVDKSGLFTELLNGVPIIIPVLTAFIVAELKSFIEITKNQKIKELFVNISNHK